MKIQKIIIYIISILTLVSLGVYLFCLIGWQVPKENDLYVWKSCVTNISVGIFGSSIVSVIVAIITYCQERTQLLDQYIYTYRQLFSYCSEYPKGNKIQEKVKWFQSYKELSNNLATLTEKISFLLDCRRNRNFFRNIAEYYTDFTLLTQSSFLALEGKISVSGEEKENLCKLIDNIVVDVETTREGILVSNIEHNRLTHNKELVFKSIAEINSKQIKYVFKKAVFNQTLVTPDVFELLDEKIEIYVRKILKEMKKTNSGNVEVAVPEDVCQKLLDTKYLYRYSKGEGEKMKLDCQFVLYHYFELKRKIVVSDKRIEEGKAGDYANVYSLVCFFITFALFYIQTVLDKPVILLNVGIVVIVLATTIFAKGLKGFLANHKAIKERVNKLVEKSAHIGILLCLITALFELGALLECVNYIKWGVVVIVIAAIATSVKKF